MNTVDETTDDAVAACPAERTEARFHLRVERGSATPNEIVCKDRSVLIGRGPDADLVLHDPAVSQRHCVIVPEGHVFVLRDLSSRTGTWLSGVRIREVVLGRATRVRIGDCEIGFIPEATPEQSTPSIRNLVGTSAIMRKTIERLTRIAARDSPLLLEGESGTGKELAALDVHQASPRAGGPFVVVDCGSIARPLIEAELFGHERGAYTGASHARDGAFVRANGGTLFLDEIGELDIDLQPRLLGAIERREIKPIGAAHPIATNVRIVAATNRDLDCEISRGTFRSDLYYRLAVARIRLPPLRHRLEDLPLLVRHFLEQQGFCSDGEPLFQEQLLQRFAGHHWPGNVRELRNAVERSITLGFETEDGIPTADPSALPVGPETPFKSAKARVIEKFEREYLAAILASKSGNITAAASAADLDRVHLVRLLDRHGLRRKRVP